MQRSATAALHEALFRAGTANFRTADKTGFGFKLMQKMGWSEGKGLGKREDGAVKHVKVALRADNLGAWPARLALPGAPLRGVQGTSWHSLALPTAMDAPWRAVTLHCNVPLLCEATSARSAQASA